MTTMDFPLGDLVLGVNCPPIIIAEVGINHEGSIRRAMEMIDAAVEAGAPVVKFQCHIPEKEMIETDMTPGEISKDRLWDIISRCTLSESEERELQSYCAEKGIMYLSTPFSREAADRLDEMGVPAFKIGSGECNNLPLLDHIASLGKPIILSTGMNDLPSIRDSVKTIQSHGVPLALMHCTSLYPTPYDQIRLGAIDELRQSFEGLPIGLSDHTLGIWTALGAVALGACVLEKHFTTSRSLPGPDVSMSIEPHELAMLVEGAEAIWLGRGGQKNILDEEQPIIDFAYASVVSIKEIKAGEVFSKENIWVKRPGDGEFLAGDFEKLIGQTAAMDIKADRQIKIEDVSSQ